MGEANPEAMTQIADLTGHVPTYGETADGRSCLQIGDIVIIETEPAFWSDPNIFVFDDSCFSLLWGGNSVRFVKGADGQWTADVRHDPMTGKARWVS